MAKRRWRGTCVRWLGAVAIAAAVLPGAPAGARAQGVPANAAALEEAKRLNREAGRLYEEGKFDAAVPLAEQVLAIGEKALGPNHPNVATLLNNLAGLYRAKGDYGRAEPLYHRALAIREKALGPEHPDVANSLNNLALLYHAKGDYGRAEPLYHRALAIREKALGPAHPDVATSLNNLAELYRAKGDYARAEPLYQRALAINEKALGPDHRDVATSLNNLALLYRAKGDHARAEPLYQRALAINEKALGSDHPDVATSLNNLAALYHAKGEYARAEPLYQRALTIRAKGLGPDHPDVATSLNDLAGLYYAKGDYERAELFYQRAFGIREKALGPDHPDVATSLNDLAGLYYAKGDYARAEPLYQRALGIFEKALGPDHPAVATSLHSLAGLYYAKGDYGRAELFYQRALGIREKALGPDHPDVATSLNDLAWLYYAKGDYARAEPLYQRALGIFEKALGPDHPHVATSLHNLAWLYYAKGDYARAEPLYQRALGIREKALGPDHPDVATSLNNLAALYRAKGDYARAEPQYQRALGIWEKALGPDHPHVATVLNNLAELYQVKGDYGRAEPQYQRALGIWEKALGPDHPDVATSLNNLAALYQAKGDYARAEPQYQRALGIWEKALGPDHPDVASSLNNLAELYRAEGDYGRAEPLYRRALGVLEKALGSEHPRVATSLNDLAVLYRAKGDYGRAEPLLRRALSILEKVQGPEHPDMAISLNNLAALHLARNDGQAALPIMMRAVAIEERNAARELAVGSDEQRRAYMATLRSTTNRAISLHVLVVPDSRLAKQLAVSTILRRKGRVLDAMADSFGAVRSRLASPDRALFDQWRSLSAQYSAFALRGPGALPIDQYREALKNLDDQRQDMENQLSFRSVEVNTELRPVTLEQVQAAIPEGAALVELFRYLTFNAKGEARYVAYVLRHEGEIAWADLGDAIPIEAATGDLLPTFRRAAADPEPAARKLDALVMEPIRWLLGDTRWVLLSPDGVLNLVPFGALIDEHGHYLLERYSFTYLASGRDLVRMRFAAPSKGNAVVLGAPDFGQARSAAPAARTQLGATGNGNERSADMRTRDFGPLPFAADEARAIQQRIGNATLLLGPNATEGAVKALHGPPILHMATHGFFLRDQVPIPVPLSDPDGLRASTPFGQGVRYAENALLRSGLVLAGANAHKSGKDDGILTALEASQLDLYGTKLVVMSACETGIGKIESGDGVYGLRRALTIAGAETQVMSLWRVDDAATRELMEAYYDGLLHGGGRSEALRQVQLAMLQDPNRSHPYYWASFIVSGNPAALDGTPVVPDFAKVSPGMRGCGCEVGSSAPKDVGVWAAVIAVLASVRMRRRKHRRAGGRGIRPSWAQT